MLTGFTHTHALTPHRKMLARTHARTHTHTHTHPHTPTHTHTVSTCKLSRTHPLLRVTKCEPSHWCLHHSMTTPFVSPARFGPLSIASMLTGGPICPSGPLCTVCVCFCVCVCVCCTRCVCRS